MVSGQRKPILAEIRDQAAHICLAAAGMGLIVMFPVLGAALVVMLVALVRELSQHGWRDYGTLDLIFWGVGCGVFTVVYFMLGT